MRGKHRFGGTLVFIFSISFGLSGCNDYFLSGHYEGNFFRQLKNDVINEPVQIEVLRNKNIFNIRINPLTTAMIRGANEGRTYELAPEITGKMEQVQSIPYAQKTGSQLEPLEASVWIKSGHQIEISAPFISHQIILARRVDSASLGKQTACFASYGFTSVELCFKKDQFTLQALDSHHQPFLLLSANEFKAEAPVEFESPVALTLSQAVQLSFEQNFDSQIEYQHVLQARQSATAAYLNLFPHLTSNLIWNAAPNYITYLATVQALAPFILPSYWLQARQATGEYAIRSLALTIMRANLATTVEELTYSYVRDASILALQENFLASLGEFSRQLERATRSKKHPQFTPQAQEQLQEFVTYMSNALKSDLGDMTKLVLQDRFSLAEALGYRNIEAIQSILIDREAVPIQEAKQVDPFVLADIASSRSFEIKQLDEMKRNAELKKLENLFIWIDPSGDPKQSLGLNTFPQQKLAKSQIHEIEIKREQMRTQVHRSTYKIALDFNEAIRTYHLVTGETSRTQFNLKRVFFRARNTGSANAEQLQLEAQRYIASRIADQAVLANYRIARAKIDRYLLAGYYTTLLPMLHLPKLYRLDSSQTKMR